MKMVMKLKILQHNNYFGGMEHKIKKLDNIQVVNK